MAKNSKNRIETLKSEVSVKLDRAGITQNHILYGSAEIECIGRVVKVPEMVTSLKNIIDDCYFHTKKGDVFDIISIKFKVKNTFNRR